MCHVSDSLHQHTMYCSTTRGHKYKLFKQRVGPRTKFLVQRLWANAHFGGEKGVTNETINGFKSYQGKILNVEGYCIMVVFAQLNSASLDPLKSCYYNVILVYYKFNLC